MPRQRMIQPEIWIDEGFLSLSIPARLLFIGMISGADDEGRGLATDRCLKAHIFPADDVTLEQIRRYRDEVASAVNVKIYEVDGKTYYECSKWRNHQRLERPSKSTIPSPPEGSGNGTGRLPELSGIVPAELKKEEKEEKEIQCRVDTRPGVSCEEVIDCLNAATHRRYSSETKATQRLVKARANDGHTLEDFEAVIASRVKKWGSDPKMMEYLRPETLFGTKFDSYLAQAGSNGGKIDPEENYRCPVCGKRPTGHFGYEPYCSRCKSVCVDTGGKDAAAGDRDDT